MANDISFALLLAELVDILKEDESVQEDLKRLISTNFPPTSVQRTVLHQLNRRRQTLIEQIEAQTLTGIRGELLNKVIELLEGSKEAYKAPLSPIREIPAEILGYIFEFVISKTLRENVGYRDDADWSPMLSTLLYISQVCVPHAFTSSILTLLLGMLSLAERLSLYTQIMESATTTFRKNEPHSRSGRRTRIPMVPQGITLLDGFDFTRDTRISNPIPPHVKLRSKDCVSATLSFPCLESLSLTVTSLHRPDYKSNILPLIERLNAPRLSHLTLCINHTVPDIQNFGSGLRELRLELRSPRHSESEAAFPGRNIFAILKNCPRLVSLKLCIEFRDRIDGHDGHLVLRELESLEIYYFDERDDMVVPFSVLTLPKLKGLDIWFPGEFTWDRQAMQSFKNRSDFSLRRLILGHCRDDIPLDDRWEFVGDMNTLEELSIVTYVYGFELLQSLLPHNNEIQQYPLPNLRVLEVIIWNSDEEPSSETDEIVESLVKSRWWTDPAQRSYRRWAKVHIAKDGVLADFYPDVDMEIVSPETKQRMKAIGSGELSLDFDYGYPTLHL
ncbi:hypothetical protein AAF712_006472 [Marasmius tenuissimus]|uniref:F-box domain-containing protein n=1 Tax=Marasmius tenuissimus TaxID=585030 RepID=A0ABR2ZYL8_9AGAR